VFPRLLLSSFLFQPLMRIQPTPPGFFVILGWHTVLNKPGKVIPHARLPCFVAEETGDDAILDDAAYPFNEPLFFAQQHNAG